MHNVGLRWISFLPLVLFSSSFSVLSWAQSAENDFQVCSACHTIGGGRLIGPDLAGINQRRSEDWLIQFIQSSQKLIQSGDADAVAVFEEYNGMIMPDSPLDEDRIRAMLAYIEQQETAASEPGVAAASPAEPAAPMAPASEPAPVPAAAEADPDLVEQGRALFQGTARFAQGGPTCNACHDVHNDTVLGGGSLARELTSAYSNMGAAGLTAIINNAPFPVMQAAYAEQPVTQEESAALVEFLRYVSEQQDSQQPRAYRAGLLASGALGSVALFGICGFLWRGRRRGTVNQSIFDRQP